MRGRRSSLLLTALLAVEAGGEAHIEGDQHQREQGADGEQPPAGLVDGRLAGRPGHRRLRRGDQGNVAAGPTGGSGRPRAAARPDGDHALHALGVAPGRRTDRCRPSGNVTVQESPTLVMCGAGTWRRRTACPRAAPGRTRPDGSATGDPERHRPAGSIATWAGCHWLAVPSISSLRLAWPRAAPPRSGRPVVPT